MCGKLDVVAKDDSYAAYLENNYPNGHLKFCENYSNCKTKVVPLAISKSLGTGWTFRKDSPLLPIFKAYLLKLKESGMFYRIESSYDERKGMPAQECPVYDGQPIGMKKVF